jgi:hypothetical protein
MLDIRYHRQLSRSIYLWGVFTPADFGTLIIGLGLNILIFDSNAGMVALLLGYPAYLAAFRLGRPPGNDAHFFRSLFLPRLLRPGRAEAGRGWRRSAHVRESHQKVPADE